MNFEIDISDPRKLTRVKSELTRLLTIVDFALAQHLANRGIIQEGGLFAASNGRSYDEQEKPILSVIHSLPQRFTTTDVIIGMGEQGKESRGAIKLELKRAVDAGNIRVIEPGLGRRPTKYEKILH